MRLVKVALGAVNTTVGAFGSNVDKAIAMATAMAKDGATVALFPEQLVGGYPSEDLIQWHTFVDRQWGELLRFAHETAHLPLASVLGVTVAHQGLRYNCAAMISCGRIWGLVPKEKLPTYNVFYEGRTLTQGYPAMRAAVSGVPLGDFVFGFDFGTVAIEVCEDLFSADGPIRRRSYSGAELVCNVSSSPFRVGFHGTRRELVSTRASDHQCTVAYVNQVGGQDGLIFEGGGFVNQNGRMALEFDRFREGWESVVIDLDRTLRLRTENTTWRNDRQNWASQNALVSKIEVDVTIDRAGLRYPAPLGLNRSFFLPTPSVFKSSTEQYCEDLLDALALGIGDYYEKTRAFRCIGIALSGGRDSLLTLLVAHRYATRANVPIETFYMPSRYSSAETENAAKTIAAELGIKFSLVSIDDAFSRECDAAVAMLGKGATLTPITLQNIQARIRAQRMWNWANTSGGLFLQTGNMSEKAVGYTTVGGDLMGALAVIANIPKTVVIFVLDYMFQKYGYEGIRLVTARPAGPELAPDQHGEAELMPFTVLDACFHLFAGEKMSPNEVLAAMVSIFPEIEKSELEHHVAKFLKLFTQSIYKWVQSPLSLHVGTLDLDRERALQLPVVSQTEWSATRSKDAR